MEGGVWWILTRAGYAHGWRRIRTSISEYAASPCASGFNSLVVRVVEKYVSRPALALSKEANTWKRTPT